MNALTLFVLLDKFVLISLVNMSANVQWGKNICLNMSIYVCLLQLLKVQLIYRFAGTNCSTDIDYCSSKPCQNNANCTDGLTTYTCTCLPGKTFLISLILFKF